MNYKNVRASAASIISKSGKSVTIRVPAVVAPYDPIVDSGAASVVVDYACKAVELNYKQFEIDGTMIQANDRRFLVSGLVDDGTALAQPDTIKRMIVGVATLAVVSVEPLNPGDTTLLYMVQCRG